MKKFLAIAIISAFMVACNNGSDADAAAKDSIKAVDSIEKRMKDSIEDKSDAAKDKVDSLADKTRDSINKNN